MKIYLSLLLLLIFSACNMLGSGENDDGPPRTIVYSSNQDGSYQIYTMREDGSGIKQLTESKYSSVNPAWSPDGKKIAYATYQGKYGGETLWVMNADGSNKEPLVKNPRTDNPQPGSHPSWSPDGTKIAFDLCLNCERGGNNYEVLVADLKNETIDSLTTHFSMDREPVWSPGGKQIAFTSNRNYYDADTLQLRTDVYVYHLNEDTLQRVSSSGYARGTVWHKEGTEIISGYRGGGRGLLLIDLETNNVSRIRHNILYRYNATPIGWSNEDKLLIAAHKYPETSFYFLNRNNNELESIPFNSVKMLGADWNTSISN